MTELAELILKLLADDIDEFRMNGDPCECDPPFNSCDYHTGYFKGAHALLDTFKIEEIEE